MLNNFQALISDSEALENDHRFDEDCEFTIALTGKMR